MCFSNYEAWGCSLALKRSHQCDNTGAGLRGNHTRGMNICSLCNLLMLQALFFWECVSALCIHTKIIHCFIRFGVQS